MGVLAMLAAAVACSPASSLAATEVQKPSTEVFILLGKNRGYEVGIWMPNPRIAVLQVTRFVAEEPFSIAHSSYGVRVPSDSLRRGVVRFRFPSMGAASLRFEPNKRRVHRQRKGCRGKQAMTESGWFRGTVSLEGEGGYFKLETRSARGAVVRSFRLRCEKGAAFQQDTRPLRGYVAPTLGFSYSPGKGTVSLLNARASGGGRSILLRAAHYEGAPPGAEVQVGALEWQDGIPVGRSAFVDGGFAGTLTTSLPGVQPASATLAPPAPFSGQGSFLEGASPASNSWSGTLGVSFPGLDLPLTGTEFETSLCVVSPLKVPAGCDFIRRRSS